VAAVGNLSYLLRSLGHLQPGDPGVPVAERTAVSLRHG